MQKQRGYRILVTGGAGFIGSNLVHYLLGEASDDLAISIDRVVTLDKLTYAGNRENLATLDDDSRHRLVLGDICDANLVGTLLREEEINLVMHLAAESHVDRSIDASAEFIRTNVIGTHTLLEEFRAWANELGFPETDSPTERPSIRFLHVSTDEVYGSLSLDDPAFSETTPYTPNSPYSASKAASYSITQSLEQVLREQGTQVVSVHPGPIATEMADNAGLEGGEPPSVVADSIMDALQNGRFHAFPDEMARQFQQAYQTFAENIIEADLGE